MKVHFYKYQATGNDFILVDNRTGRIAFTTSQIEKACDRRFGIGADGLILLGKDELLDFNIVYYNADGTQSLCGNGCRSAIDLAAHLGLIKNGFATFSAFDGPHNATIISQELIQLRMNDVKEVKEINGGFFVDTGSPHFVTFVTNLNDFPVTEEGRKLRYAEAFKPNGTNANFVELLPDNTVFLRTYERGVEAETFSCGTGATAACLAASFKGYTSPVIVKVRGGELKVEFKSGQSGAFHDISLIGPAKLVFEGDLEL